MFNFIKKYLSDTIALPLIKKKDINGEKINLHSFGNLNKKNFFM